MPTKDELWDDFEKLGEAKVKEHLAVERYGPSGAYKKSFAELWLEEKAQERREAAEARNAASSLENMKIARSAKNAAWIAAIAAIAAAISAIIALIARSG